ncbi:SDR family NAD(P)-dependent oxidoreductase [Amycolatopsis suaedae]|uniref:SDR family NAD(P)-dependent oxidoreductase n=1 Tax=Amycolatopsis suaedae TaxID=2510978 RepID=A0A4Q7IYY1_9PSEU|nr:SDR family NAD(P)-dependent oxidoreductase [Amycolatopsis suaedae]RZQ60210.1 SDR family NAD(P)-dependent oxidoreductase [Amycolatopsis suaedae]
MTTAERPLAVVTGASSGIGLELAATFARNGFDLLIAAEDEGIEVAADGLRGAGVAVRAVRADLAGYDGVEHLVEEVTAAGRPVDSLIVNAGVATAGAFAGDETTLEDQLRVVNLNVTSAVHLTKRLVPAMVRLGAGRVLFTSSIAGASPGPFYATYAASKAFLTSFAGALREELAEHGVTVTALLPGPTDTEFFDRAGMRDTKVATGDKDDPADVATEAYRALMEGKDKVVAGSAGNVLQEAAGRLLPDQAKARQQRRMAEPGSGSR